MTLLPLWLARRRTILQANECWPMQANFRSKEHCAQNSGDDISPQKSCSHAGWLRPTTPEVPVRATTQAAKALAKAGWDRIPRGVFAQPKAAAAKSEDNIASTPKPPPAPRAQTVKPMVFSGSNQGTRAYRQGSVLVGVADPPRSSFRY